MLSDTTVGIETEFDQAVTTVRVSPAPSAGLPSALVASLRVVLRGVRRGESRCLVLHQVGQPATDLDAASDEVVLAPNEEIVSLLDELFSTPVPILSVAEGHVSGYGTVLTLVGDVRFGGPDTAFSVIASDDAPPPIGAAWLLADRVGGGVAAAALLWPQRLDAGRARDAGLLSVVSESDVGTEVAAAAARIAADRSGRRQLVGRMLRRVREVPFTEALEYDRYACRPADAGRPEMDR